MLATPNNIHVSQVLINAPMDIVWGWVSDPSKFPTIYPNWIREAVDVSHADEEHAYHGEVIYPMIAGFTGASGPPQGRPPWRG